MSGASRENKPSETALREAWSLIPNLMNCAWFTGGGTGNLSAEAVEYADMIIRQLEVFKTLIKEEVEARTKKE